MSNQYTLYGAPLSLYTGKARAYLINKRIPYEEVFSSLKIYKKIIIPNTGVRFVPVLKTPDGEYIQDTSAIIDSLEKRCPLPLVDQGLDQLAIDQWKLPVFVIFPNHYQ